MPKRLSRPKRPGDISQWAHQITHESTEEKNEPPSKSEISRVMREMGRRGGKKGGKRRMETMTFEQRSKIGLKAAQVRWAKEKQKKED